MATPTRKPTHKVSTLRMIRPLPIPTSTSSSNTNNNNTNNTNNASRTMSVLSAPNSTLSLSQLESQGQALQAATSNNPSTTPDSNCENRNIPIQMTPSDEKGRDMLLDEVIVDFDHKLASIAVTTSSPNHRSSKNTKPMNANSSSSSTSNQSTAKVTPASSRSVFGSRYYKTSLTDKNNHATIATPPPASYGSSSKTNSEDTAPLSTATTKNAKDGNGSTGSSTSKLRSSSTVLAPAMTSTQVFQEEGLLSKETAAAAVDTANSIIDELRSTRTAVVGPEVSLPPSTQSSVLPFKRWTPGMVPSALPEKDALAGSSSASTSSSSSSVASTTASTAASSSAAPSAATKGSVTGTSATRSSGKGTPAIRPSYRLAATRMGRTITTTTDLSSIAASSEKTDANAITPKLTNSSNNNRKPLSDNSDNSFVPGVKIIEEKKDEDLEYGISNNTGRNRLAAHTTKAPTSKAISSTSPAPTSVPKSSAATPVLSGSPIIPVGMGTPGLRLRYGRSAALKKKTKPSSPLSTTASPSPQISAATYSSPPASEAIVPTDMESKPTFETKITNWTTAPNQEISTSIPEAVVIQSPAEDLDVGPVEDRDATSVAVSALAETEMESICSAPVESESVSFSQDLGKYNHTEKQESVPSTVKTRTWNTLAPAVQSNENRAVEHPKQYGTKGEPDKTETPNFESNGRGIVLQSWRTKLQAYASENQFEDNSQNPKTKVTNVSASTKKERIPIQQHQIKPLLNERKTDSGDNLEKDELVTTTRSRFDVVAAADESWMKRNQMKQKSNDVFTAGKNSTGPLPGNNSASSERSVGRLVRPSIPTIKDEYFTNYQRENTLEKNEKKAVNNAPSEDEQSPSISPTSTQSGFGGRGRVAAFWKQTTSSVPDNSVALNKNPPYVENAQLQSNLWKQQKPTIRDSVASSSLSIPSANKFPPVAAQENKDKSVYDESKSNSVDQHVSSFEAKRNGFQEKSNANANSNESVLASWRNRLKQDSNNDNATTTPITENPLSNPEYSTMRNLATEKVAPTSEEQVPADSTLSVEGSVLASWRNRINKGSDDISSGPQIQKHHNRGPSSGRKEADASATSNIASSVTSPTILGQSATKKAITEPRKGEVKAIYKSTFVRKDDKNEATESNDGYRPKLKKVVSPFLTASTSPDPHRPTPQVKHLNPAQTKQQTQRVEADLTHPDREKDRSLPDQEFNEDGEDSESVSVASRRNMLMQKFNGGITTNSKHDSSIKKSSTNSFSGQSGHSSEGDQTNDHTTRPSTKNAARTLAGLQQKGTVNEHTPGVTHKWRRPVETNLIDKSTNYNHRKNDQPDSLYSRNDRPIQSDFDKPTNYRNATINDQYGCVVSADSYGSSYTSINSFAPIDDIPSEISPQSSSEYCNRPSQFKMTTSSSIGSNDRKPLNTLSSVSSSRPGDFKAATAVDETNHPNDKTTADLEHNFIPVTQGSLESDKASQSAGRDVRTPPPGGVSVSAMKAQLWASTPSGDLKLNVPPVQKVSYEEDCSTGNDMSVSAVSMPSITQTQSNQSSTQLGIGKTKSHESIASYNSTANDGFGSPFRAIPTRADVSTPVGMSPPHRSETGSENRLSFIAHDEAVAEIDMPVPLNKTTATNTLLKTDLQNTAPLSCESNHLSKIDSSTDETELYTQKTTKEKKSIKDSILSWVNGSFKNSSRQMIDMKSKSEEGVQKSSEDSIGGSTTGSVKSLSTNGHTIASHNSEPAPTKAQSNHSSSTDDSERLENASSKPPTHDGFNQHNKYHVIGCSEKLEVIGSETAMNGNLRNKETEGKEELFDNKDTLIYRSTSLGDFQVKISPGRPSGPRVPETSGTANTDQLLLEGPTSVGMDSNMAFTTGSSPANDLHTENLNPSITENNEPSFSSNRKVDRPWIKDQRTLSPESWQRRKIFSFQAPGTDETSHPVLDLSDTSSKEDLSRTDVASMKQSSTERTFDAHLETAPVSLPHHLQISDVIDSANNGALVDFVENFGNTIGELTHESDPSSGNERLIGDKSNADATVIFGNPVAFGAAGGEDETVPALTVSERAKALEKWKGGLGVPPRKVDKQEIIRKEIGRSLSPIRRSDSPTGMDSVARDRKINDDGEKSKEQTLQITGSLASNGLWVDEGTRWTSRDNDFDVPNDYEVLEVDQIQNSFTVPKELENSLNSTAEDGWGATDLLDFPSNNNTSILKAEDLFDPFSSVDDDELFQPTVAISDEELKTSKNNRKSIDSRLSSSSKLRPPPQDRSINRQSRQAPATRGFDPFVNEADSVKTDNEKELSFTDPFAANDPFSPESIPFKIVPADVNSIKKSGSAFDPFGDEGIGPDADGIFESNVDLFAPCDDAFPKMTGGVQSKENSAFDDNFFAQRNDPKNDFKSGYDADQSNLYDSNFEI